jgi:FO synthase subunit 2
MFETGDDHVDALDEVEDQSKFGSYFELIKIDKYKYKNPREK